MMPGRMGGLPLSTENPLGLSWHDSAWIPMLNPTNIMEYFAERSNPFFDRTCNNEIVKMQRLSPDQLQNMTGLEYILLHVQEPILYVIRKQHRHSPTQVTPLANYYIIVGVVYQAPDLASVLNSRLLSAVHHLQMSFEETTSYSRYHPSKGYYWDFKPNKGLISLNSTLTPSAPAKETTATPKEEPSTLFQRQRVDMLLAELVRQFPLPIVAPNPQQVNGAAVKTENQTEAVKEEGQQGETASAGIAIKQEPGEINTITNSGQPASNGPSGGSNGISGAPEVKLEIKQENMKPPPDKKPRLI